MAGTRRPALTGARGSLLRSVVLAVALVLLTAGPADAHGLGHSLRGGHQGSLLLDLVFLAGPVLTLGWFFLRLRRELRAPVADVAGRPERSESSRPGEDA
jgi:hypothetical protein